MGSFWRYNLWVIKRLIGRLHIEDARIGEVLGSESVTGTAAAVFTLVTKSGALLRSRLGVGKPSPSDAAVLREEFPANLDAARLYISGLERLRAFDPLKAREYFDSASRIDPRSPVIHYALAESWAALGYKALARIEARKALDLSGRLSRENQLLVESPVPAIRNGMAARHRNLSGPVYSVALRSDRIRVIQTALESIPESAVRFIGIGKRQGPPGTHDER